MADDAKPTARQAAIDNLLTEDAKLRELAAAMGAAAKAWAAAQKAADNAWLDLLRLQGEHERQRVAQMRARLMLIATPEVPAADPMGNALQA